jgi:glycosyltransferase involved in cell wall biosynthesis
VVHVHPSYGLVEENVLHALPAVSIIVCTHNRCADLAATLQSVAGVAVPADVPTELLVVDNASTDATSRVVTECGVANMRVRYVFEGRKGKGYAYNRGMAEARGDVFLFTDDDVRVPECWVDGMCAPILAGDAEVAVGGVRIARHLHRSWFTALHRAWFASTDHFRSADPCEIVGANMAFSRSVLSRVPAFDPALGPGGLGFGDESLFFDQCLMAGFRAVSAADTVVEHHFGSDRLTRLSLLDAARRRGRSIGYILHHWEHCDVARPRRDLAIAYARLAKWRWNNRRVLVEHEGASEAELLMVRTLSLGLYRHRERLQPRRYDRHGFCLRAVAD